MKGYLTFTRAGRRWYDVVQRYLAYTHDYAGAPAVIEHHEWVICEALRFVEGNVLTSNTVFVDSDIPAQMVKSCLSQLKSLLEGEPDDLRLYFAAQITLYNKFDEFYAAFMNLMNGELVRVGAYPELLIEKNPDHASEE